MLCSRATLSTVRSKHKNIYSVIIIRYDIRHYIRHKLVYTINEHARTHNTGCCAVNGVKKYNNAVTLCGLAITAACFLSLSLFNSYTIGKQTRSNKILT